MDETERLRPVTENSLINPTDLSSIEFTPRVSVAVIEKHFVSDTEITSRTISSWGRAGVVTWPRV